VEVTFKNPLDPFSPVECISVPADEEIGSVEWQCIDEEDETFDFLLASTSGRILRCSFDRQTPSEVSFPFRAVQIITAGRLATPDNCFAIVDADGCLHLCNDGEEISSMDGPLFSKVIHFDLAEELVNDVLQWTWTFACLTHDHRVLLSRYLFTDHSWSSLYSIVPCPDHSYFVSAGDIVATSTNVLYPSLAVKDAESAMVQVLSLNSPPVTVSCFDDKIVNDSCSSDSKTRFAEDISDHAVFSAFARSLFCRHNEQLHLSWLMIRHSERELLLSEFRLSDDGTVTKQTPACRFVCNQIVNDMCLNADASLVVVLTSTGTIFLASRSSDITVSVDVSNVTTEVGEARAVDVLHAAGPGAQSPGDVVATDDHDAAPSGFSSHSPTVPGTEEFVDTAYIVIPCSDFEDEQMYPSPIAGESLGSSSSEKTAALDSSLPTVTTRAADVGPLLSSTSVPTVSSPAPLQKMSSPGDPRVAGGIAQTEMSSVLRKRDTKVVDLTNDDELLPPGSKIPRYASGSTEVVDLDSNGREQGDRHLAEGHSMVDMERKTDNGAPAAVSSVAPVSDLLQVEASLENRVRTVRVPSLVSSGDYGPSLLADCSSVRDASKQSRQGGSPDHSILQAASEGQFREVNLFTSSTVASQNLIRRAAESLTVGLPFTCFQLCDDIYDISVAEAFFISRPSSAGRVQRHQQLFDLMLFSKSAKVYRLSDMPLRVLDHFVSSVHVQEIKPKRSVPSACLKLSYICASVLHDQAVASFAWNTGNDSSSLFLSKVVYKDCDGSSSFDICDGNVEPVSFAKSSSFALFHDADGRQALAVGTYSGTVSVFGPAVVSPCTVAASDAITALIVVSNGSPPSTDTASKTFFPFSTGSIHLLCGTESGKCFFVVLPRNVNGAAAAPQIFPVACTLKTPVRKLVVSPYSTYFSVQHADGFEVFDGVTSRPVFKEHVPVTALTSFIPHASFWASSPSTVAVLYVDARGTVRRRLVRSTTSSDAQGCPDLSQSLCNISVFVRHPDPTTNVFFAVDTFGNAILFSAATVVS
jgi:hypothetical protein